MACGREGGGFEVDLVFFFTAFLLWLVLAMHKHLFMIFMGMGIFFCLDFGHKQCRVYVFIFIFIFFLDLRELRGASFIFIALLEMTCESECHHFFYILFSHFTSIFGKFFNFFSKFPRFFYSTISLHSHTWRHIVFENFKKNEI